MKTRNRDGLRKKSQAQTTFGTSTRQRAFSAFDGKFWWLGRCVDLPRLAKHTRYMVYSEPNRPACALFSRWTCGPEEKSTKPLKRGSSSAFSQEVKQRIVVGHRELLRGSRNTILHPLTMRQKMMSADGRDAVTFVACVVVQYVSRKVLLPYKQRYKMGSSHDTTRITGSV